MCELYARHAVSADVCIVEGMMGMFDGYDRDRGSSAEIAQLLQLPVVLVVDAKSAAYSMAPCCRDSSIFVRIYGLRGGDIQSCRVVPPL